MPICYFIVAKVLKILQTNKLLAYFFHDFQYDFNENSIRNIKEL